jgi:type II secretory pathway component PulK
MCPVKYLLALAVAFCLTLIWQTYLIAKRTPNLQSYEQEQVIIKNPQTT